MLNSRSLILLAIALVLALAAVFVAQHWLSQQQQQAAVATPPALETIPVLVAAAQINPHEKIRPDQVKILDVPKNSVPFDASLPGGGLNFYTKPEEVIGKITTQTVYPNEFMVRQRIRDSLGGSTLSNLLSPSMRAVSVRVDDVTGVAGFLAPGNHVDILTNQKALDSDLITTRLLLQNVKVLAVDQVAATDDDGKPIPAHTVTVELRPQDASKLARASVEGNIQMSLRNPKDDVLLPEGVFMARDDRPRPEPAKSAPPIDALQPPEQPAQAVASQQPAPPRKQGAIRTLLRGGTLISYECFKDYCEEKPAQGGSPLPPAPGVPLENALLGGAMPAGEGPRLLPE
jgi:pilus assembly protein CpaB